METYKKISLGLLFSFIILFFLGFKNKTKQKEYQSIDKANVTSDLKITGNELFQKNCATCHGTDRKGNPPTFPSLLNIKERMTKNQIETLLKTGRKIMPNFSYLSDSERNVIVGFLYGESTSAKTITKISSKERGKNLFVANCTRCHKVNPNDETPKDQKNWGMKPPILGGISERFSEQKFKSILNFGPCYMPSFNDMKDQDKSDIFTYLSSLDNPYKNNNQIMGSCRMQCNTQ